MKKVLFATTALVFSAGFAAAEVTLSGDGRMGMIYDGDDVNFTSRARVEFGLSGNTDSGLEFGGSFRVDHEDEDGASASRGGAGSVYIKGSYGKLSMGDVDGALESAVGDLAGVGLTGLGDYNEVTYLTGNEANDDPGALYEYSAGAASFYASMNDGDPSEAWAIGAKYAMDAYTVGLGYEDDGNASHWAVSGSGTFGGATVKAVYGDSSDLDFTQYGLSVDYAMGATGVTAYWIRRETAGVDSDSLGIGASYDLGGGATLKGGIVDSDAENDTIADFGVSFKF